MPDYRRRLVDKDPLEAPKPIRELREGEKIDALRDASPESPEYPDKENLVVVMIEPQAEKFSGSRQRLSWDLIKTIPLTELLAVGYDRGYWKRGVAKLSDAELRAFFSNAQEEDRTLDV